MRLTEKQKQELVAVFQAESVEHIKVMAELFLTLEQGSSDTALEAIDNAFREAHSLKGAAGTLGFGRVEALTHKLEDALGVLVGNKRAVNSETVDLLLTSLDVIRVSTLEAVPGQSDLTRKEIEQIKLLDELAASVPAEPVFASEPSSVPPSDVPNAPPLSEYGGQMFELESSQLEQLAGVFRAESLEHIKTLSEVMFALEDGSGDEKELLTIAFRAAHSMKGSAGTLGFNRCEVLTHHLEDVFGQLSRGAKEVVPEDVDVLLSALDVIKNSIETSVSGDKVLTKEESKTGELLSELASQMGSTKTRVPAAQQEEEVETESVEEPVSDIPPIKQEKNLQKKEPHEQPAKESGSSSKKGEVFIRIAESRIDSVIAQISELFEANLHLESLGPDLDSFCTLANEIGDSLGGLLVEFAGSEYETELYPLVERARNLHIQLRATVNKFEQNERRLTKLIQTSQEELRAIRMAPVSSLFIMLRRQIRETSKATRKKLDLSLGGGEYAVDRKVLDAIEEPLIHILRNTASHGIEDAATRKEAGKDPIGHISVVARHTGDAVDITVADDGGGIDPEKIRKSLVEKRGMSKKQVADFTDDQLLDFLFESGFTTQKKVTKISGRGVGLDVVKYTVERLGGEVRLDSQLGKGTAITLRLPLSMSTIRCLLLRASGRMMAIPASNVEKVIIPTKNDLRTIGGSTVILYGGQNVPLGSLGTVLGLSSHEQSEAVEKSRIVVVITFGDRRFAFGIDELVEYTQLILKPLGDLLERVPNISGVSLLGSGETALVLSPPDLIRSAGGVRRETKKEIFPTLSLEASELAQTIRVLVTDDSIATRTLEKTLLESAGFIVETASDGYKALDILNDGEIDIVLSDIQMPNMDGIELARTIKSRAQLSHLPVILISSLGSDEDKARGLAAGADAYIVKRELTQQELVNTINQLL